MKRYIILVLSLSFLAIKAYSLEPFPGEKFEQAAKLYSESKFQEAADMWLSIYNMGYRSAQLDYNIGNAYFKLNNVPGAILFYERALLLKPADEDINYNLQIARTMVVDKFAEIPELFFVTWFNFVSLELSSNSWAVISLASFILFLLILSVYLFTSRYRLKVLSFWGALFLFFISIAGFSFSYRNKSLVFHNNNAIIFCPQVNGKSSPDESGNDLFLIHEGTKVSVEDEVGEWYEIRLSDGNKGWVPANCLSKI